MNTLTGSTYPFYVHYFRTRTMQYWKSSEYLRNWKNGKQRRYLLSAIGLFVFLFSLISYSL